MVSRDCNNLGEIMYTLMVIATTVILELAFGVILVQRYLIHKLVKGGNVS